MDWSVGSPRTRSVVGVRGPGVSGRVPFDQNFRKFRFKIKWNRKFPETHFENFGQPLEVVLFSGNLEIPEIFRSISTSSPGPTPRRFSKWRIVRRRPWQRLGHVVQNLQKSWRFLSRDILRSQNKMAAEEEFEIYLRTRKRYVRGIDGFIERPHVVFVGFLEAGRLIKEPGVLRYVKFMNIVSRNRNVSCLLLLLHG